MFTVLTRQPCEQAGECRSGRPAGWPQIAGEPRHPLRFLLPVLRQWLRSLLCSWMRTVAHRLSPQGIPPGKVMLFIQATQNKGQHACSDQMVFPVCIIHSFGPGGFPDPTECEVGFRIRLIL